LLIKKHNVVYILRCFKHCRVRCNVVCSERHDFCRVAENPDKQQRLAISCGKSLLYTNTVSVEVKILKNIVCQGSRFLVNSPLI